MSAIKFILIIVLIGYNVIFILQHFVIYANPDKDHDLTVHSSDDSLIKSAKRLADDKSRGVHLVGANRKESENDAAESKGSSGPTKRSRPHLNSDDIGMSTPLR